MALGNHRTIGRVSSKASPGNGTRHGNNTISISSTLRISITVASHEMKNVLSFWLDRDVDGFRIDAISHLFEDTRYLDEP